MWATAFAITDTKVYGPVVTLSTQDNVKLLQQLKSGFTKINTKLTFRLLNWSKFSGSK